MSEPYSLEELDDIIFIAVTCGINAAGLIRRRDALAAAAAQPQPQPPDA